MAKDEFYHNRKFASCQTLY